LMAKRAPRRAISIGATAMLIASEIEEVTVGNGFKASVNGLTVEGTPDLPAWADVGQRLRVIERGAQFALGDYINLLEEQFGEEASQIIDAGEWSLKTCAVYRWLARSIAAKDRRMDRLTIAHHLQVAALDAPRQRDWLRKAADDGNELPWTVARMKAEMKTGEPLMPVTFWVLVSCKSEKDQRAFIGEMEKIGRACKAVERRERVEKAAKAKKAKTRKQPKAKKGKKT
jgi:hypothetical protein